MTDLRQPSVVMTRLKKMVCLFCGGSSFKVIFLEEKNHWSDPPHRFLMGNSLQLECKCMLCGAKIIAERDHYKDHVT